MMFLWQCLELINKIRKPYTSGCTVFLNLHKAGVMITVIYSLILVISLSILDAECSGSVTLDPWVIQFSDVEATSTTPNQSSLTVDERFNMTIRGCFEDGLAAQLHVILPTHSPSISLVTLNNAFFTFIESNQSIGEKMCLLFNLQACFTLF